jgi:hypothetical protein
VGDMVRWAAPAFSASVSTLAPSFCWPRPKILRFALAKMLLSSSGALSRIRGVVDVGALDC